MIHTRVQGLRRHAQAHPRHLKRVGRYRSNLLIKSFQSNMVSHIWPCHKLFKYCVLQRIIASALYFFIIRIYWDAKHPVWFMGVQSCSLLIVGLGLTDIFQNNCCNLGIGSSHYQTIFNCFLHKFRLIIFTFCFHNEYILWLFTFQANQYVPIIFHARKKSALKNKIFNWREKEELAKTDKLNS